MTRISRISGALAIVLLLAGCETIGGIDTLERSARSEEMRKETTEGTTLPPGCPTLKTSVPPGQAAISVSYQEPKTDLQGRPLSDLAFTTLYITAGKATRAIRVWTNNAAGGTQVTVTDIPVSAQEIGLCVTASNWSRKESPVAPLSQAK